MADTKPETTLAEPETAAPAPAKVEAADAATPVAPAAAAAAAAAAPTSEASAVPTTTNITATADPTTGSAPTATAVPAVPAPEQQSAAPAPIPTAEEKEDVEPPKTLTPLAELWAAAQDHGHPEIWGVPLSDPAIHIPSQIVFQKYLNANDGDVTKAKDQLLKTLEWRAKTKPVDLAHKAYNKTKFAGLGFVSTYTAAEESEPEHREVFTWNIYGGVKSIDETFGNLEEFIEWRVALMELALQELAIQNAVEPISAEYDPYKIFQVHDYKSVSFFKSPPHVKSASAETIKVFAQNYPELLKEKFFVNVPAIMGFMYSLMKLFVAAKTIKKFHPMSNGGGLAKEFADSKVVALGEKLPVEYGGKGADLKAQGKEPLLE
ncbi:CRAL-TRIO domain-containing protein [Podospora australis]|uniref:Phosphatidylinositol transfer protein SFH5 n=1 Tax=Podospora australis TaxID=1536484 RepID=A0AAN6X6P1_9PEZI|nr:CRAL-TRIO domain-containing protein [Podospora australis]